MTDKSFDIFRSEYTRARTRISEQKMELPELKYFLDTQYLWACCKADHKPQTVVLGTGIPEELVIAAGTVPYWLTGGSLGSIS